MENQNRKNSFSKKNIKKCNLELINYIKNNKNSSIRDIQSNVGDYENKLIQKSLAFLLFSGKLKLNRKMEYRLNYDNNIIGKAK